ncbi:MAG: 3-phosphoshikimate 1-carboxyvinyltransferase [Phycisphaerae bacterium]|nr:3-phosphoshikimate 1-carboxyvinyltransferase [Phycisphaerae bacterium]
MTREPDQGIDALPDPVPITAVSGFDACLEAPGSKSITNRALVLAALAEGTSTLEYPLVSTDTVRMAIAMERVGANIDREAGSWIVNGLGSNGPTAASLDLGDGGTPARFCAALALLGHEPITVDGSSRLRQRPMEQGLRMLQELGASIECLQEEGHLPVRICGPSGSGSTLSIGRTASSQFISAILLVAPRLPGGIRIEFTEEPTSSSYIRLTIDLLRQWGITVEHDDAFSRVQVHPGPITPRHCFIEPDASTAIYGLAAAAISLDSTVTVPGIGKDSLQPDIEVIRCLQRMGADVHWQDDAVSVTGSSRLHPIQVDASLFPDGAVLLAACCALADGASEITGLHTLRVKESDRITALHTELEKVGCSVQSTDDSIRIEPGDRTDADVMIRTYDDHRIAMSMAVLGTRLGGLSIEDPACVIKSHPGFWHDMATLGAIDGGWLYEAGSNGDT